MYIYMQYRHMSCVNLYASMQKTSQMRASQCLPFARRLFSGCHSRSFQVCETDSHVDISHMLLARAVECSSPITALPRHLHVMHTQSRACLILRMALRVQRYYAKDTDPPCCWIEDKPGTLLNSCVCVCVCPYVCMVLFVYTHIRNIQALSFHTYRYIQKFIFHTYGYTMAPSLHTWIHTGSHFLHIWICTGSLFYVLCE